MKKASLSETKNNLSALIDQVRHGETIVILDRGRPVARIESVLTADIDPEGRIARLERAGIIRRGRRNLPRGFFGKEPPAIPGKTKVVETLIDERRHAR